MEIKSRMINIDECHALLTSIPSLGRIERVSLNASLGRVLAEDILADTDQPPFNKSAMDGYACVMSDLPGPLSVAGSIAAGAFAEKKLEPGNCYRIFTGAPVPAGADCVMSRLVRPIRKIQQIEHERGEPQAVAELLDRHSGRNHQEILWLREGQEHKYQLRQVHRANQVGQHLLQSVLRRHKGPKQAAARQRQDPEQDAEDRADHTEQPGFDHDEAQQLPPRDA